MQKTKIILKEEELIAALKKKQKIGMEVLYDMYAASLLGVIHRIIPHIEIAEDTLQEVFIKIWHHIDTYQPSKGRLFTWMLNISRNMAIDKVRSKDYRNHTQNQNIENFVDNPAGEIPLHSITLNEETLGIQQLVMSLKTEWKDLLELIYFKGYTHVEAAEKLQIPLGTVKTRLRAALIELRKNFNH